MVPTRTFRLDPASPRRARWYVDEALVHRGVDDRTRETVRLLVSEVVTNAVLHARSDCHVAVEVGATDIRVEVDDESPEPPVPGSADPSAVTGRGLHFLDELSTAWGWTATDSDGTGKCVWFEVARADVVPTTA